MTEEEKAKWTARYQRPGDLSPPTPLLIELAENHPSLPRHGRGLDVAGGTGRHAIWLAERGLDVLLVDIAANALEQARAHADQRAVADRLRTLALDLDIDALPAAEGPFDLIVWTNFLHRPALADVVKRLAPGGWLVLVHPTMRNLDRHAKPSARLLLDDGELARPEHPFATLNTVVYREEWTAAGRHEAWYAGVR